MSDLKPGRGSDQFPLRLPDGMRERIKDAADRNGRSMNAEIVATLELAYPDFNYRTAITNLRNAMTETVRLGYPGGVRGIRDVIMELAAAAEDAGVDVSDLISDL